MKLKYYYTALTLVLMASACAAQPPPSNGPGQPLKDGDVITVDKGGDVVSVRSIERTGSEKKQVAWLGVAVEEAPEAFQAQLDLKAGQGLVVTMVASNSPAFAADLRKFDVLSEFDGQMLVDAIQLRKLVQMHSEGDTIGLTVFRGGKKISVSAKLAMTSLDNAALENDDPFRNFNIDLKGVKNLSRDLDFKLAPQLEKMKQERKTMTIQLDQAEAQQKEALQQERRAMKAARDAMEQALREHPEEMKALAEEKKDFAELAEKGISVDDDASVVVKKDTKNAKSIVTTDDSGTYIIVADPRKHLTAHDQDGKQLFDGEVETPEQQAAVPKAVWEKVKPMIDQLGANPGDKPESKSSDAKGNS